jgi:hypothetical protein
MKHLKRFETYSINEEEGKISQFFRGHDSSEDRDAKMREFFKELDSYEEQAKNDTEIVFNRQSLEKKAKDNNYKGHLEARDSRSGGTYIIYVDGVSDFGKLASLAANRRDNPLG